MNALFLSVLNMSITASFLLPAVLILRLLLKKAPRYLHVLLWAKVALRLICPISPESNFSLLPKTQWVSETTPETEYIQPDIIDTDAIAGQHPDINVSVETPTVSSPAITVRKLPNPAHIWLAGILLMTLYTAVSYLRLRRQIGTAIRLRENIYRSENITSPFVLGFFRPIIYLPCCLAEADQEYVIAHEAAHIRRLDHIWKPLGFALLSLHWFNPLMWLAYVLLCRDIEAACDEKVIRQLGHDGRADYSQALLNCSVHRRAIAACPLAFGEVNVRDRVKSVLHYKKPAFWIILAAIVACILTAVCFLTDPATPDDSLKVFIDCQIAEHHQSEHTAGHASVLDWKLLGQKRKGDETTLYMWVLYEEYSCEDGILKQESGAHSPTAITVTKVDGGYRLVEYWTPRDGSYYDDDIRAKVPWYLYGRAIDSQRYIDEQKAACERLAREYFADASASDPLLTPPIQDMQSKQEELETELALKKLRAKYPVFFDIPTENGLSIYMWQMAETSYRFSFHYQTETQANLMEATKLSVSLEDMRLIVSTYDIDPADIRLIPISCVYSSYHCAFDDAYYEKVENMFAEDGFTIVRIHADSVPISFMHELSVEEEVHSYVTQLAAQYIETYNRYGESQGWTVHDRYHIVEAQVRDINICYASGGTDSVRLYRAELALRPNQSHTVLLGEDMELRDGYFMVYTPYFAMYQGPESNGVLIPIGLIDQDTIAQKYGTKEMLQKYGDKYKAAAMEMRSVYLSSLTEDTNTDLSPDVPEAWYTFTYEGVKYDLSKANAAVNGVYEACRIGDYVIAQGHVNPRNSVYAVIHVPSQKIEKFISAAAGTIACYGDDINTLVYAFYSGIYTYDGTLLSHVNLASGEYISSLEYTKDRQTLRVTIRGGKSERQFERQYISRGTVDPAMYIFEYDGVQYDLAKTEIPMFSPKLVSRIGEKHLLISGSFGWYNSAFALINISTQTVEKTLVGKVLEWRDDDVTTMIYNTDADIFDYEGKHLAHIELYPGEYISVLAYSEDGTEITVRVDSEDTSRTVIETSRTVTIPR